MSRSDGPVILEAAINGMTSTEKNPHSPREAEDITRDALRCFELGATIVHAHNSDMALVGQAAADDYLKAWRPVFEARPDVYLTQENSIFWVPGDNINLEVELHTPIACEDGLRFAIARVVAL